MKSPRVTKTILASLILLLAAIGCTTATSENHSLGDVAIKGYDPVAYFVENKAVKGNSSHAVRWHDMTWYFASKANSDLFTANPKKYAPQYDGYCAWSMTEARKAVTDPRVWKIVAGKLYLNCSRAAYEKWSRDIPGNIKKADANWAKLHNGQ